MSARLLAVAVSVLAVSGCTATANGPGAAGRPSVPPPPSSPALESVPPAATASTTAAALPAITATVDPRSVAGPAAELAGPASGRLTLLLDGIGEVAADVTGECTGSSVRVSTPERTSVVIGFGDDSATIRVTDTGLDLTATLLPGDITISKPTLAIATTLRPSGSESPGGRIDLDLTCGS